MDVKAILSQPDVDWDPEEGADDSQIQRLVDASPKPLPQAFLSLLRFANGGEGKLDLPPMRLRLFPVDEIEHGFVKFPTLDPRPDFFIFGSNGGGDWIAFDFRGTEPPWPIVSFDMISGPISADIIALDIETFILAIGHQFPVDFDPYPEGMPDFPFFPPR